ncbi:MAG: hypothetical protein NC417_04095 [Candidatus Gastranaerophilales bacterium]|nr:hypothetical protein [Candidatus Gastranaerophilales bacterium]
MRYCLLEVKKLLEEKLFWIFLFLCLGLNMGVCFGTPNVREAVNQMTREGTFLQGEKIYDTLDTNVIGSYYYNERYIHSTVLNRWIKEKYEKLQASVDSLNRENADLSFFAGEITPLVHQALFTYQVKLLLAECVILISLLGLRSFSVDQQAQMDAFIFCSRRGRKIAKDKILANGIVSAGYCLFLQVISLTVFFMSWDFSGLWDANMASSFHYVIDPDDPILAKPFLTWSNFTLKKYFWCSMLLVIGVLTAWWLLSNFVAVIVRNIRYGGIALAGMFCLPVFGLLLFPKFYFSRLFYLDTLTLSTVIYCNQWWFTDLGSYSLFAYQEVWTVVVHILLTAAGLKAGFSYFRRKELG